jgi:hypothetical protein
MINVSFPSYKEYDSTNRFFNKEIDSRIVITYINGTVEKIKML